MKCKRQRIIGGSTNIDYSANWYALYLSIIKNKSADESLNLMAVIPDMKSKNIKR